MAKKQEQPQAAAAMPREEALKTRFQIDGREVALRESITTKQARKLPEMIADADSGDFYDLVRVARLMVVSWGFDGDPAEAASYDELDFFRQSWPLVKRVVAHVAARLGDDPNAS